MNTLGARLSDQGMLERRADRVLGVVPRTRWPVADTTHKLVLARQLSSVLVQGTTPDARTGALVAVLVAIDRVHKVVDHSGLSKREVKQRAKAVAEGEWAASAVRAAIQATSTAVVAAVAAAAAVSSG